MPYAMIQSTSTTSWISICKKNQKVFKSHLKDDGTHLNVTHLVWKIDDIGDIANDCVTIDNNNLTSWIKKHNGKPVNYRVGWTGWQKGLTDKDRDEAIKNFYKNNPVEKYAV